MKNDLLKWLLGIVQALVLVGITAVGTMVMGMKTKIDTNSAEQSHISTTQAQVVEGLNAVRSDVAEISSDVAVLGERLRAWEARVTRLEDK